jgi:hypothetical protein
MDEVVDNMNHFMDLLTEASEMDMEGEMVSDMEERVANAIGNQMQDVARDIKQSNQEVVENLDNINESLRKTYASQNKGSVRQSPSAGSQAGSQASSRSQGSGRSQGGGGSGLDMGRGGRGNQNQGQEMDQMGGSNDDRMEKLKQRFNQDRSNNE